MKAKRLEAVIFDLDGTLTVPYLDFDAIRAEIGGIQGPILEALAGKSEAEKTRAFEIIHRHELDAAENSQLQEGAYEMLRTLRTEGRKIGLLTRNRHDSVERICAKHDLSFDVIVTREDGPIKPDPFGVTHACRMLGVQPEASCVVGDYLYDLIAGRRAGAISILLSVNQRYKEFLTEADYVIDRLPELPELIRKIEKDGQSVPNS